MDAIYLDHASTTPLRDDVFHAMLPFLRDHWGNASSVHSRGRTARHAVENARDRIATLLGVEPAEVVFTSGGTESNNTIVRGATRGLVTARTEHDAVLGPAESLSKHGVPVRFASPGAGARFVLEDLVALARPGDLISLMHVNNETGARNSLAPPPGGLPEGCTIHSDMVQSAAWYPLKPVVEQCDFVTLSGHKLGGPKGVGVLVARRNALLEPLLVGGGQERDRRSGTENVAGIVGMAEALELAQQEVEDVARRIRGLRDAMWSGLHAELGAHVERITPMDENESAPYILQILTFGTDQAGRDGADPDRVGLDGEMLLLGLDMAGVHASAGSACSSGSLRPSHVVAALGIPDATARGVLRFSLGRATTRADVERAVERTVEVIRRMQRSA